MLIVLTNREQKAWVGGVELVEGVAIPIVVYEMLGDLILPSRTGGDTAVWRWCVKVARRFLLSHHRPPEAGRAARQNQSPSVETRVSRTRRSIDPWPRPPMMRLRAAGQRSRNTEEP